MRLASGNINEAALRRAFELVASGNISPNNHEETSGQECGSRKVFPSMFQKRSTSVHELSRLRILRAIFKDPSYPGVDREDSSIPQGNMVQVTDCKSLAVVNAIY